MPTDDLLERARDVYRAFASGDRTAIVRLVRSGEEVIVTYHVEHPDGHTGRNTEVLTFRGDRLCRAEVYFGWNVE
jgi:hypothetical protein